jgi:hypothetical protein
MKTAVEFGCHSDHKISVCKPLEKKGWKVWYFGLEGGKDIIQCFITAENINYIFKENNVPKDLDLLSIDIDGMDYWVWKALEWKPKEVIIEYNARRLKGVQPYFAHNHWNLQEDDYYGASKEELIKLGKEKGYEFYGQNEDNLFFKLYANNTKKVHLKKTI